MKKFTYSVAIAATLLASSNTFAQQGFGTNTPHRSSAVEIQSTNKGLLIPRVELTALNNAAPIIGTPQNSLLIYNTKTDLNSNLVQGYYFWKATNVDANGNSTDNVGTWIPFATGNSVANLSGANGVKRVGDVFKLGDTPIDEETILTVGAGSLKIVANDKFFINGAPQFATGDVGLLVRDQNTGLVQNMGPDQLFNNYLNGKNGVKTVYNTETTITDVKLGGTIDEVTNLHIADNASVSVTGLKKMNGTAVTPNGLDASVTALGGGHLIPVGTTMDGTLKVATAKEIVDAGIVSVTNIITPAVHTPASGENPGSTTEGTLVTKVNDDTSVAVDMTALVQSVQKTYRFTSNNQSVAINETLGSNANGYVNTIDLAVSTGNIEGAGSLTSDDLEIPTNTALLASLEINIKDEGVKANHINVNVAGQGLVQEESGALKVNVNNGLQYGTDTAVDANGDLVQLGGALTRATTITTGGTTTPANTLAIAGLQNANVGAHKNVTVDTQGVLRTTDRIATTATENAEQVILKIDLEGNQTLELTEASVTVLGQVVHVIISQSDELGTLYITGDGTPITGLAALGYDAVPNDVLAFGGMEGQKFTFKCVAKGNSYEWEVVSQM